MLGVSLKKSVLFINPLGIKAGQPSFERIKSFKAAFETKGFSVFSVVQPKNIIDILHLIKAIINNKYNKVFISHKFMKKSRTIL